VSFPKSVIGNLKENVSHVNLFMMLRGRFRFIKPGKLDGKMVSVIIIILPSSFVIKSKGGLTH